MDELEFYQNIILKREKIILWHYDTSGSLIDTNSDDSMRDSLHKLFFSTEFFERIKDRMETEDTPFGLGTYMGLIWFAIPDVNSIYLLGPVYHTKMDRNILNQFLQDYEVKGMSIVSRHKLLEIFHQLPVISRDQFEQYVLMLDTCIHHRYLEKTQLSYLVTDVLASQEEKTHITYRSIFDRYQGILSALRNGEDIRNKKDEEKLDLLSNLLPTKNANLEIPLRNLKDSAVILIGLCAQTAIEKHVSPVVAYEKADCYIASVEANRSEFELQSIIYTMYQDYLDEIRKINSYIGNYSAEVTECLELLEHIDSEDLSIESLAADIGYTPYYLSRKFQSETGEALPGAIRKRKLQKGMVLLDATDEDIAEIADALGFASGSHFARCFKSEFGINPSEYRRQHR